MEIKRWIAWYADGSRYESSQTEWERLPRTGVILVLVGFEDGTMRRLSGADYYYSLDGMMVADNGLQSVLERLSFLKEGRWTTDEIMKKAEEEANAQTNLWASDSGCGC